MRWLALLVVSLYGTVHAGDQYPLWDGESVADYAKRVNLPPTRTLDLGNGVKMELVLIPAGKFTMGTPEPKPVDEEVFQRKILLGQVLLLVSGIVLLLLVGIETVQAIRKRRRPRFWLAELLIITVAAGGGVLSWLHWRQSARKLESLRVDHLVAQAHFEWSNAKSAHAVTLTTPFYMDKFDVTQEQYQQMMNAKPSHFKGMDHPVEMVSWNDTQDFCKKMSELSGQAVCLPMEAEWEFACRAGTTTAYYSGNTDNDIDRVAWCRINSKNTTHPTGQKEANAFGLYDMHGNVFQWCADLFGDCSVSVVTDPQGATQGTFRVLRGGSWQHDPAYCRSAERYSGDPAFRGDYTGFRVVLRLPRTP